MCANNERYYREIYTRDGKTKFSNYISRKALNIYLRRIKFEAEACTRIIRVQGVCAVAVLCVCVFDISTLSFSTRFVKARRRCTWYRANDSLKTSIILYVPLSAEEPDVGSTLSVRTVDYYMYPTALLY